MAVTAGLSHSCALTRAGGVRCWGYNGHDELGDGRGTGENSSTPEAVAGLTGVRAISAGTRHTCAVTHVGGVKCWGANYSGALGDGTIDRHTAPVSVSGLASGVVAVAAGYDDSCALLSGGAVKCWGSNAEGQLGDGTTFDRLTPVPVSDLGNGVVGIAAGVLRTCALTKRGAVMCWGVGFGPTPTDVTGLSGGVTAISSSCALTSGGRVECWGGSSGRTPVEVAGLRGVTAFSGGVTGHGCAIVLDGGVRCWGLNDHGQLGDGTRHDRPQAVAVSGLSHGVAGIAAAGSHSCALTGVGGVKCWGSNGVGELGDGTTKERLRPVDVVGLTVRAVLAIASRTVTVTPAGVAAIELRCGVQVPCSGKLVLSAPARGRHVVWLGRRLFAVPAGRARAVAVRLAPRAFRLLLRARRLAARARVSYAQPGGSTRLATRLIALLAPER